MLRRERSSPEAKLGLKPKAHFALTTSRFCHTRRQKWKGTTWGRSQSHFLWLQAGMEKKCLYQIENIPQCLIWKKKNWNLLTENMFQNSINLLFLPSRTFLLIAEGCRWFTAAALYPLSISDSSAEPPSWADQARTPGWRSQPMPLQAGRCLKVCIWSEESLLLLFLQLPFANISSVSFLLEQRFGHRNMKRWLSSW